MTERHALWHQLDAIQMDLRAASAKMVELRAAVASLNLPADWKPPRPGSPRELHPDACPECEVAGGHTAECSQVVS